MDIPTRKPICAVKMMLYPIRNYDNKDDIQYDRHTNVEGLDNTIFDRPAVSPKFGEWDNAPGIQHQNAYKITYIKFEFMLGSVLTYLDQPCQGMRKWKGDQ